MDYDKLIIRQATTNDIDFIVDTIVAAEKSGTENFGLAKLFEVTEGEMRSYIKEMLEEEVDGCELSISSFIVAEYEGETVAAFGGWIEGRNEDNMPSALLKANLINYYLPKEKVLASMAKSDIVKPLQIEREEGTYQLEYSYTKPKFRGFGIMNRIINTHISNYQQLTWGDKIQVRVFGNNSSAIRTYSKCGFTINKRYVSNDSRALNYFPDNVQLLMEKNSIVCIGATHYHNNDVEPITTIQMFDESKLIIRPATIDDVEFLATVIIEAEKSSTDKNGTANNFEITGDDYREYLIKMLEEEVDGCELSISSFVVAEYDNELIAARGGWMEGDNEDELPSSILKANLFQYYIPKYNLMKGMQKLDIVKEIQIEREMGTYQFEFSYTKPEFRGYHILGKLNAVHIERAKQKGATKMQVHTYKSNTKSINASCRSGFKITKEYASKNPLIKSIYPDDTMVLMEKEL